MKEEQSNLYIALSNVCESWLNQTQNYFQTIRTKIVWTIGRTTTKICLSVLERYNFRRHRASICVASEDLCSKFLKSKTHPRVALFWFCSFCRIIVTILLFHHPHLLRQVEKYLNSCFPNKIVDKTPLPTAFTNSLVAKYIDDRPLVQLFWFLLDQSCSHTHSSALYAQ